MPAPREVTTARADPSHEAEAFLSLLWRHIYTRVQSMLHPHHMKHEPGGSDALKLPIGFLADVDVTGVGDGDALTYDASTAKWVPGAGGGGYGELLYWLPGVLLDGAQSMRIHNRMGVTLHISEVFVDCYDVPVGGGVTFSVSGLPAVGISAGGSTGSAAADFDFEPEASLTVSLTVGDAVAGNALIHLPYTY